MRSVKALVLYNSKFNTNSKCPENIEIIQNATLVGPQYQATTRARSILKAKNCFIFFQKKIIFFKKNKSFIFLHSKEKLFHIPPKGKLFSSKKRKKEKKKQTLLSFIFCQVSLKNKNYFIYLLNYFNICFIFLRKKNFTLKKDKIMYIP